MRAGRAGVAKITFSRTKYPHIRAPLRGRGARGLADGADAASAPAPTRVARGCCADVATRRGLWTATSTRRRSGAARYRADVAYVPSSENRSHGSTLGIKLRRYCDGTRFRYVFY